MAQMKNILLLAIVFLALLAIPVSADDADIAADLQGHIDGWISFANEKGMNIITYGQPHLDGGFYKKEIELEPGLYTVWGEPDSTVDVNDFFLYIRDEDGKYIGGYSKLPVNWDQPWAEFMIDEAQTVSVELIISHDNGPVDAYAAYIMVNEGVFDDQARLDYINIELDNLTGSVEYQDGSVIQAEYITLTEDDNTFTFDRTLPAGAYLINGVGGLVMSKAIIEILNDNGDVIFSDKGDDRWPGIEFNLDNSETLTFKYTVEEFRDDYTEDYFCYCLSSASSD
jgi:hypothetical protein